MILFVLAAACTTTTRPTMPAIEASDGARKAETAFAKAFADRDRAAFGRFIANDAVFLSRQNTSSGKDAILKAWESLLSAPQAPFRWEPTRVVSNARGDLALSTGPIYDTDGKVVGNYISTWQRQRDGSWQVIFDGPGSAVCPTP